MHYQGAHLDHDHGHSMPFGSLSYTSDGTDSNSYSHYGMLYDVNFSACLWGCLWSCVRWWGFVFSWIVAFAAQLLALLCLLCASLIIIVWTLATTCACCYVSSIIEFMWVHNSSHTCLTCSAMPLHAFRNGISNDLQTCVAEKKLKPGDVLSASAIIVGHW